MKRLFGVIGTLAIAGGCAHQAVFMDAEVEYPRLESSTCSAHAGSAYVDLAVRDSEHVAIPGAAAYLLPMNPGLDPFP
jgi:hypothetical protein